MLADAVSGVQGNGPGRAMCAVPTGLRTLYGCAFPTLKRGANEQCAYGAG